MLKGNPLIYCISESTWFQRDYKLNEGKNFNLPSILNQINICQVNE